MNCVSKEKAKGKGLVTTVSILVESKPDATFGITCNANLVHRLVSEVSIKTDTNPHSR